MLFRTKVKKWGNSVGIIIPKKTVDQLKITAGDEITVEIVTNNPLKEFFGAGKNKPLRREDLQALRQEPESKWW